MGRPRSRFEQWQRVQWEFRDTSVPDPSRRKFWAVFADGQARRES